MKKSLLALAMLGTLATANGGRPADAQITESGPYYANPSWDQQIPGAQRFIVLSNWNNAAVLDRETGLVWEQDPVTAHPSDVSGIWATATTVCVQQTTGGRAGWRLPSVHELASLVDPSAKGFGVALPAGNPFTGVVAGPYWSATVTAFEADTAYFVTFDAAFASAPVAYAPVGTGDSASIWCVRGGGPLQAQ